MVRASVEVGETFSLKSSEWEVHRWLLAEGYQCGLFAGSGPIAEDWQVRGYTNLLYTSVDT